MTADAAFAPGDAAYPARLRALEHPPAPVHVAGALPPADRPAVAIVGTREPTAYGARVARQLAEVCARAGVVVVSGLARGVDAAAHQGALEAGGLTTGVVAGGTDVPYPRGHAELQRRVAASGGVVSEWPPGTAARPWAFPRRNAFIAALADVTVVVEAAHGSGALITADDALRISRPVAAVPGPIDSPQSAGANRLLRDGAHVVGDADDLLALVGVARPTAAATPADLADDEGRCWEALGRRALDAEGLSAATGLSPRAAMAAVGGLEIRGLVAADWAGVYRRRL